MGVFLDSNMAGFGIKINGMQNFLGIREINANIFLRRYFDNNGLFLKKKEIKQKKFLFLITK